MNDDDHLKRAFAVARRASRNGNPPFGAVLVRGCRLTRTEGDGPGARSLIRPREADLFR